MHNVYLNNDFISIDDMTTNDEFYVVTFKSESYKSRKCVKLSLMATLS